MVDDRARRTRGTFVGSNAEVGVEERVSEATSSTAARLAARLLAIFDWRSASMIASFSAMTTSIGSARLSCEYMGSTGCGFGSNRDGVRWPEANAFHTVPSAAAWSSVTGSSSRSSKKPLPASFSLLASGLGVRGRLAVPLRFSSSRLSSVLLAKRSEGGRLERDDASSVDVPFFSRMGTWARSRIASMASSASMTRRLRR